MRKCLMIFAVLCGLASGVCADGRLPTSVASYLFSEGLSAFLDPASELWGYIDRSGKVLIPPQFDGAGPFSGGLAVVSIADDSNEQHDFVIDRKGTVLFQPEKNGYSLEYDYDEGSRFREGLAVARTGDGRYAFVDAAGRIAGQFAFASLSPLSEGLACYSVKDKSGGELYGFIDAKGKEVIPAHFGYATSFHDGLAYASTGSDATLKQFYIDRTGKAVFDIKFNTGDFSEGLAVGSKKSVAGGEDEEYVFIDTTGKEVLTLAGYDRVESFSGGRALVRKNYYFTGFIDRTGREIVEPTDEYVDAGNYSEGLAAVVIGENIGFIDLDGKLALPAIYSAAVPGMGSEGGVDLAKYVFSEGLSPYYDAETGKWGFIDGEGGIAIEAVYDGVHGFSCGLALIATLDEDYEFEPVFIDMNGETAIDPADSGFTVLSDFSGDLALVRLPDESLAYIDTDGDIALDPDFAELRGFSDGMAIFGVEVEEKTAFGPVKTTLYGYLNVRGKAVIPAAFLSAQPFAEGLAYVRLPAAAGGQEKTGYIDKTGRMVLEFSTEDQSFSDGLFRTAELYDTAEGKSLIVFDFHDRSGKSVLSIDKYRWISDFTEGRARIIGKRERMGYIDRSGREIVPPTYKTAGDFSEGFAAVAVGSLVGFIDRDGKLAIPARFAAPAIQFGKGGDPEF